MNILALIDALRSTLPQEQDAFPLHEPEFIGHEWDYVKACLDTGWVSSVGSFVDRFEEDLAKKCSVKHAVATVNGTAALHTALMVNDIGEGDEVFVPTLTFVATANAVSYTKAKPHFIDCETHRLGIDARKFEQYLENIAVRDGENEHGPIFRNRHTNGILKAVMPMHVFGIPTDMDALNAVAAHFGLIIIEDAAEALGSTYKGAPAGSLGKIAALSFNGNKIITSGGGGAVLTNDDNLAVRMRHLSTTAKQPHPWAYQHNQVGYNYRLPNLNAALGCAQLEQLDMKIDRKRKLTLAYAHALERVDGVELLKTPIDSTSNHWLNAIILKDGTTIDERNLVLEALHESGLLCRPVWNLMHTLPMFSDYDRMDVSCAENMLKRIINIPSSAALADGLKDTAFNG